ncbi:MAG: alginate export family protein [Bacteroidaceae bacterium]|nr:alginate export family protein [Bacteroidaceae bacterium]
MRKFLTFIAVAFAMASTAQEKAKPDYGDFTLDAQVRSRGEYRGGMESEDTESELSVNDRVRLSFGWERKNISMKIAAQHIGLWQNGSGKGTVGKLALHEAWAGMTFGNGFFAQAGRQELSYDDERLLGAHDWAISGRTHDALRVGWENPWHKVHAIVSFNQTAEMADNIVYTNSTSAKLYKNMQTLWYHYTASTMPFEISGIFINQGSNDIQQDKLRYMQTLGTYMTYKWPNISADLSLYYQLGRDRAGADIRAYRMSGNVSWAFLPKWTATLGDDYLSGSDGYPGTNRTFNVLYGSHHKFFGAMDNFTYSNIPLYGLNDLSARVNYNLGSRHFDVSLAFHWLITGRRINNYLKNPTEELTDPVKILIMRRYNGKYRFSQNLGQELDLQVNYCPWRNVTIQGGFSLMLATETMQLIKGTTDDVQRFAWVSLNLNPTIFSTK